MSKDLPDDHRYAKQSQTQSVNKTSAI